jgi:hypothetical protein
LNGCGAAFWPREPSRAELIQQPLDTGALVGRRAVPRSASKLGKVFRIIQQMKAEGISVLLVEQNARMSLEIADDAYVLDDGIVVYSGSARELAADDARVRALAGASAEEWRRS